MRGGLPGVLVCAMVLVLSCSGQASGQASAQSRDHPTSQPDPYRLLVYALLDLDQEELFGEGEYNPLLELKAWSGLYARLRSEAMADSSEDRRSLKAFMLMGWIASATARVSTTGAFKSDLMELFEARPGEVLDAMAGQEFMLDQMCAYLAGYFFYEDADPDDRQAFIDRYRDELESGLGAPGAGACIETFWRVSS